MWVIANGAPKSGSTWILQLLKATRCFSPLPPGLQDKSWNNPAVDARKLPAALPMLTAEGTTYLSKQHWPSPQPLHPGASQTKFPLIQSLRQLKFHLRRRRREEIYGELLGLDGIKMCNIVRDLRDVLVSLYHHQVRLGLYRGDIGSFLHRNGEAVVKSTVDYHRFWMEAPARTPSNYFITAYEYLSDAGAAAADQLFDFTDLEIGPEEREKALDASHFDSKKSKGPDRFFRKGRAFSFDEDLSPPQAAAILDAAKRYNYAEVKRAIATANPRLTPYLTATDIGLPAIPAKSASGTG